ncbi:response regulator [Candidatus Pyrohabitans sp.]
MQEILIVEDDPKLRQGLKILLEKKGYSPKVAEDGVKAINMIKKQKFDLVITDLVMPGADGMEVLRNVKKHSPLTKVIIITAFGTVDSAVRAMKMGASDYILKPFKVEEIRNKILRLLEETRIEAESREREETGKDVLKSLSNPTRRRIMEYLHAKGKARFTDIMNYLGIREPAKLGFHLRVLKQAGLLAQDENRHYYISDVGEHAFVTLMSLEG